MIDNFQVVPIGKLELMERKNKFYALCKAEGVDSNKY